MMTLKLFRLVTVSLVAAAVLPRGAGAAAPGVLGADAFAYQPPAGVTRTAQPSPARGVAQWRVTFISPSTGEHMNGLLFAPQHRTGTHSGVLFVHWLGDPGTSNATEFARDAITLAQRGFTSLSMDEPWSKRGWFERIRTPQTDYEMSLSIVKNLRASLDVLTGSPGVNRDDIAIVAHDFGAMYAAIAGAYEPRVKHYVLIAGIATLGEWFMLDKRRAPDVNAYNAQMARLEPADYIALTRGADHLFQFAQSDEYIPLDRASAFFSAAPAPRTMAVYEATHAMHTAVVFDDRMDWLLRRLH